MPTINVYSNKFSDECEVNTCDTGLSLQDYLMEHCNGYEPDMNAAGYFSASINGKPFHHECWDNPLRKSDVIDLYIEPKGTVLAVVTIVSLIASYVAIRNMNNLDVPDNYNSTTPDSSSIYSVNAQGNQPRLMGPVPVLFGTHKLYPDVISPSHRQYVNHEEWRYFMLGVAAHGIDYNAADIRIGDTSINDLGSDVSVQVFQPGQNVTGHAAHRHMYSAAETDGTGVEMKADLPEFQYASPYVPNAATYQWRVQGNTKKLRMAEYYATGENGEVIAIQFNQYVDWKNFLPSYYDDTNFNGLILMLSVGQSYQYFQVIDDGAVMELQRVHYGTWIADESWTGFGAEDDLLYGFFKVINTGEYGAWSGWFNVTPPGETTTKLEFDFHLPDGLCHIDDRGVPRAHQLSIEIEYESVTGSSSYTYSTTFNESTVNARGYTIVRSVPGGEWKARARVYSVLLNDQLVRERIFWNGARSELTAASTYPYTTMAVAIKGTQRLSSAASNKINLVGTGEHPVLQSNLTWSAPVATRSVSAAVGYIAKSAGNDDSQINLEALYDISQMLDARGDYFDGVFDKETTAWESLKRVLAIGWGQPVVDYGQIVPVRDAETTELGSQFSEQNITTDITETISMPTTINEKHDGVEVEFIDSRTYKSATIIVTLDGQAGNNPEKKRVYGLVDDAANPVRAIRMGLRYLRTQKYRNRTYEFGTEQDALECRLYDPIQLGWAMPHRSQTGELKAVDGSGSSTTLLLSEPVQFTDGEAHTIIVNNPEGKATGPYTATATTDPYQITLDRSLEFEPDFSGRQERPRYQFGTVSKRSIKSKIQKVTPKGTDSASVTLMIDDPRVYADDNYGVS